MMHVAPCALVLLLVVDSLRADHLSMYGYEHATTPNLARFAASAVVFDNVASSTSWTLPSVASMLTGMYPTVHGLRAREDGLRSLTTLRPEVETLPVVLHKSGYRTYMVSANAWLGAGQHGLGRGFETSELRNMHSADRLNARAQEILSSLAFGREPIFLYVHYMDAHYMFYGSSLPPRPDVRFAAYDAAIASWDDAFGKLLAWLDSVGLLAKALVIVTADHGDEFGEHGHWGHSSYLHRELLRVPWIMRVPGEAPRRVSQQVSLIDMAPTILGRIGVDAHLSGVGVAGQDVLAPAMLTSNEDRQVFAEVDAGGSGQIRAQYHRTAIKQGNLKLVKEPDGSPRCFDLALDPGEVRPLEAKEMGCAKLNRDLDCWTGASRALARSLGPTSLMMMSEADRERLRQLGYK